MTLSLIKAAGLFMFFCSIFFLIYSLLPKGARFNLEGQQQDPDIESRENARFILVFKSFYQLFFPLIKYFPVPEYKKKLNRFVVTAGLERDVTADDMIGFQLTMLLIFSFSGKILFDSWFYIAIAGFVGLIYPYLWIYEKKKQRQTKIRMSMPDIVDMLSLMVEAGLAFSAAIQRICSIYRKDNDPFVTELYQMDQNIKLGRSREEALKIMADRVDISELDSFCSILIQANKMGSNISDVLKSQAERMRSDRFLKAEKLGAQASQKLLIPMMLFIFPTIFIIIFGPYLIQFILGT
jgi:tight adherence protein C